MTPLQSMMIEELDLVTQNIWKMMLRLPIDRDTRPVAYGDLIRASIRIEGPWNGILCLEFPETLAMKIARQIFVSIPHEGISQSLVLDAVREIANITGGNLKSAIPDSVRLAIPEIEYVHPPERHLSPPFVELWYRHGQDTYGVSVYETTLQ